MNRFARTLYSGGQWHRADHAGIGMDRTVTSALALSASIRLKSRGHMNLLPQLPTNCFSFSTTSPTPTSCTPAKQSFSTFTIPITKERKPRPTTFANGKACANA